MQHVRPPAPSLATPLDADDALAPQDAFNIECSAPGTGQDLELKLFSLRNREPLVILCQPGVGGMAVSFHTEDMEPAGELVQVFFLFFQ